jgi:hypothetical protein
VVPDIGHLVDLSSEELCLPACLVILADFTLLNQDTTASPIISLLPPLSSLAINLADSHLPLTPTSL